MKKEDSRNTLGTKEKKLEARRWERKLPDPFLSLRSKDGRTGAKRNACQREKEPRRGRAEGRG